MLSGVKLQFKNQYQQIQIRLDLAQVPHVLAFPLGWPEHPTELWPALCFSCGERADWSRVGRQ